VEAAADLDMKIAYRFIECEQAFGHPRTDFARKTAGGCDSKFARIRARARDDIQNGARAGFAQSDADEFTVQIRKVGFRNPSQYYVLLDRRPKIVSRETSCN